MGDKRKACEDCEDKDSCMITAGLEVAHAMDRADIEPSKAVVSALLAHAVLLGRELGMDPEQVLMAFVETVTVIASASGGPHMNDEQLSKMLDRATHGKVAH